jgi:hypothetical protein
MILAVKLAGLPFGDFALPQLFIDPPVPGSSGGR